LITLANESTTTTLISAAGDIIIAVGGCLITIFAWLAARTAKDSINDAERNVANALQAQLDSVFARFAPLIDSVTRETNGFATLTTQVNGIGMSIGHVRQDLLGIRQEVDRVSAELGDLASELS
jgi:hypothetical protein